MHKKDIFYILFFDCLINKNLLIIFLYKKIEKQYMETSFLCNLNYVRKGKIISKTRRYIVWILSYNHMITIKMIHLYKNVNKYILKIILLFA